MKTVQVFLIGFGITLVGAGIFDIFGPSFIGAAFLIFGILTILFGPLACAND